MSIINNCVIIYKKDQKGPMFLGKSDGSCDVELDGYAIIPLEDYEDLKKKHIVVVVEPLDNRGLEECFWCKRPTKMVPSFTDLYNYCSICKK